MDIMPLWDTVAHGMQWRMGERVHVGGVRLGDVCWRQEVELRINETVVGLDDEGVCHVCLDGESCASAHAAKWPCCLLHATPASTARIERMRPLPPHAVGTRQHI